MRISIIIVSWNTKKLLKQCLESIYKLNANVVLEVFVIDNDSRDNSVEMVENDFPQVKLIANTENLGFAAANNQGIQRAGSDYILLLNPDTELANNHDLYQLTDLMKKNPKIGIIGCKHYNPDKSLQPSVRRFPTLLPVLLIFFKLAKLFPGLPPLKRYFCQDFDYSKPQKVDQVAGSYMLIRKEVFRQIGLLDEQFFCWFEEVDFCKRAHDAGREIWYSPAAEIIHHGGQSFKQALKLRNQLVFFRSALKYFKKHGFKR